MNDFSAILSGAGTQTTGADGCTCYRRMGLTGGGGDGETTGGGGSLATAVPWLLVALVVVLLVQDGGGRGPGGL